MEVTLTLDMEVAVLEGGWIATNPSVGNKATVFTKTYGSNVAAEVVRFVADNLEGQATVTIDRIDTTPPQAVSVDYTPATLTNGEVVVKVTLNETGTVAMT